MLHKSVIQKFADANILFEGYVPHMYQDIKGLVTTGVGNLIDPYGPAVYNLPWYKFPDELDPSMSEVEQRIFVYPDEIRAEWERVKADKTLALSGAGAAARVTKLRLTERAVLQLVQHSLINLYEQVVSIHPDIDDYLPQMQMVIMSMTWALGPTGLSRFRRFNRAVKDGNLITALYECGMDDSANPGLTPRNRWNEALIKSAMETQWLMSGDGAKSVKTNRGVLTAGGIIKASADAKAQG